MLTNGLLHKGLRCKISSGSTYEQTNIVDGDG